MNNHGLISVNPAATTLGTVNGLDLRRHFPRTSINSALSARQDSPLFSAVDFLLAGERKISLRGSAILCALRISSSVLFAAFALSFSGLHIAAITILSIAAAMIFMGLLTRPASFAAQGITIVAMLAFSSFSLAGLSAIILSALPEILGAGRFSLDNFLFRRFKESYKKFIRNRRLSYAAYNYRFH